MNHFRRKGLFEQIRRLFGGNPPRVQASALPWRRRDDSIEVLLITSRDTGRWVLPKGWPEGRETLWQAAEREAQEEAGVHGAMSDMELGRYFYEKDKGSGLRLHCEVAVFPLEVKHEAKRWPERKERMRRWVEPEKASRMVAEPDLAELLAAFDGNLRQLAA